jgi:hypothetical protein
METSFTQIAGLMDGAPAERDISQYDTLIFDIDQTIITCYSPEGKSIPAYMTKPPYRRIGREKLRDSEGNLAEATSGAIQKITNLFDAGKRLFILSKSEDTNLPEDEQPARLILEEFGILPMFEDVVLDRDAPKSEHIPSMAEGDTAFVDDDAKNLRDVKQNTGIDVIPASEEVFAKAIAMFAFADLQFGESRKNIEEDRELAISGIYTQRNEQGEIDFRIDLNKGIIYQVSRSFSMENPELYPGRPLTESDITRFRGYNETHLQHFDQRLNTLYENADPNHVVEEAPEKFHTDISHVKDFMAKTGIVRGDQINYDKLEQLYHSDNPTSKFVAGTIHMVQFYQNGSTYHKKEAESLAFQIAGKEIYGSYDGEAQYLQSENIDHVPLFYDATPTTPKNLFRSSGNGQDADPVLWNMAQEAAKDYNYWLSSGVYMYVDRAQTQLSEAFKRAFPEYADKREQVIERASDLAAQMMDAATQILTE